MTGLWYGRKRFQEVADLNIIRTGMLCRTTEPINIDTHLSHTVGTMPFAHESVSCKGDVASSASHPDNSYEALITFDETDVAAELLE